jgi:hypothetical protein
MNRTVYVSLGEGEVIARCLKEKVAVSVIERLPGGGVRLVCMSSGGAERMRAVLKKQLLDGAQTLRERHRPATPLW